jgi:SRSO17 transposase
MDPLENDASRVRLESYIEQLSSVIGHADRVVPLHDYCTGLLLPGEPKSVEPMAALTAPAGTTAKHQSLLHFVATAPWSGGCADQSARDGAAKNRSTRRDRGLDH